MAQADPTRVYEGMLGERNVELVTLENASGVVSGYLLDRKGERLLSLERTPYEGRENLMIDVIDKGETPFAALSLRDFTIDAGQLQGV